MTPKYQQTFTLIDIPVGFQNGIPRPGDATLPELKPPMTSKQAQRLHRLENRRPRMNKEEERRLEKQEQDRIRKEFEKDKAAKRARFLREKKREKEQATLEEKRRKGLPLFDVHPSQATISWFVRGKVEQTKRKIDELEEPEEQPKRVTQARPAEDATQGAIKPPPRSQPGQPPGMVAAMAQQTLPSTPAPISQHDPALPPNDLTSNTCYALSPPPSTQFIMSHLDDFFDFPTPSQADWELQEEFGTPALPPQPSRTAARRLPPVPKFGESSATKSVPSVKKLTPRLAALVAPLPDQQPASDKIADRIKSAVPFFSQDFVLSSQDLQDLERTITTPTKSTEKALVGVQPIMASSAGVPPSNQEPAHGPESNSSSSQSPSRQQTRAESSTHPSLPSAGTPAGTPPTWQMELALRPSQQQRRATQQSPLQHNSSRTTPRSQLPPAQEPESSPLRFFGSSGNGINLLMALAESRKTHEEEEKRRRNEQQELERAAAAAAAAAEADANLTKATTDADDAKAATSSAENEQSTEEEYANGVLLSAFADLPSSFLAGCAIANNNPTTTNGKTARETAAAAASPIAAHNAPKASVVVPPQKAMVTEKKKVVVATAAPPPSSSSSQATDYYYYGDADFDSDSDFAADVLDMLDKADSANASAVATPVVGAALASVAGGGAAAGDDVLRELEDMGDEWLDDDIDF